MRDRKKRVLNGSEEAPKAKKQLWRQEATSTPRAGKASLAAGIPIGEAVQTTMEIVAATGEATRTVKVSKVPR